MAERAGNTVVNPRPGKGQACGRQGLAQAEGTLWQKVGAVSPRLGLAYVPWASASP